MRNQELSLAKGTMPVKAEGVTSMQMMEKTSCSVLPDLRVARHKARDVNRVQVTEPALLLCSEHGWLSY